MQALDLWHDIMSERNPERLGELLADDCVFLSPVVHTPQQGREITTLYLTAAMHVLGEDFAYVKEIVDEPHAVLEFVSTVDGISINGIDMMTVNEEGKVCEFKVMVRPLKAVHMLHAKMREMLEQAQA